MYIAKAAQIFSRRRIIQVECTSRNSLGKREIVRKVFWKINCSNLIWYSFLAERILLMSLGLVLSLRTSTWLIVSPSSSQGDQSKLGGPKESLFERSPGIGREARPPIAVVVQRLSRFCHLTVLFKILWMVEY